MADLRDITILVTSFLRQGYLKDCLWSIRKNLPECPVITIDDSDLLLDMPPDDGKDGLILLPFDSGLPAKRNAGVRSCKTPYFLLGCDDFNFAHPVVRPGIERMLAVLERRPEVSVAGGRVDFNRYEGFLELVPGEYIQEHRLDAFGMMDGDDHDCDLTVNYFLARAIDVVGVPWDERMKIGGEHFQFFWDLKKGGKTVTWVKGADITTLPADPAKVDARYPAYRARAHSLGHRIMLETMGVKEYRGF